MGAEAPLVQAELGGQRPGVVALRRHRDAVGDLNVDGPAEVLEADLVGRQHFQLDVAEHLLFGGQGHDDAGDAGAQAVAEGQHDRMGKGFFLFQGGVLAAQVHDALTLQRCADGAVVLEEVQLPFHRGILH